MALKQLDQCESPTWAIDRTRFRQTEASSEFETVHGRSLQGCRQSRLSVDLATKEFNSDAPDKSLVAWALAHERIGLLGTRGLKPTLRDFSRARQFCDSSPRAADRGEVSFASQKQSDQGSRGGQEKQEKVSRKRCQERMACSLVVSLMWQSFARHSACDL